MMYGLRATNENFARDTIRMKNSLYLAASQNIYSVPKIYNIKVFFYGKNKKIFFCVLLLSCRVHNKDRIKVLKINESLKVYGNFKNVFESN